jgi:hypothetical protein
VLESEKREKEKDWAGTAKTQRSLAHRTVWWCTGQCPVHQAGSGELATLRNSSVAYGYNSPDCPVLHRTVRRANGRQRNGRLPNPRATRGPLQWSVGGTELSDVHRTVSGAPTATILQRSTVLFLEGDLHRTMNSTCPVVHRTVRCASRQKARIAFPDCLQRLLAALGL